MLYTQRNPWLKWWGLGHSSHKCARSCSASNAWYFDFDQSLRHDMSRETSLWCFICYVMLCIYIIPLFCRTCFPPVSVFLSFRLFSILAYLRSVEESYGRVVKILMFSTHSTNYIWYSPQKSKYPRYNVAVSVRSQSRNVFFSRKSDEYAITKSITNIPT